MQDMKVSAVNWGSNGTLSCSCHFPIGYSTLKWCMRPWYVNLLEGIRQYDIRLRGFSLTLLKFWSVLMLDVQYLAQHDMASFSTDNFELWNHKGWQPIPTWIGKEIASGLIICHLKNNVPKLVQTFVSRCHVTGWVGFSRSGWEGFANWDVKLMIRFGLFSIYNPDFWLEIESKWLDSLAHVKWP